MPRNQYLHEPIDTRPFHTITVPPEYRLRTEIEPSESPTSHQSCAIAQSRRIDIEAISRVGQAARLLRESEYRQCLNMTPLQIAEIYAPVITNINNATAALTTQTLHDAFDVVDRMMDTESRIKPKKRSNYDPDLDALLPDRVEKIIVAKRKTI